MNTSRFAIVLVCLGGSPTVAAAGDRIPTDVREHITRRVDEGYCPALVVGVVDPEGVSYFSRGSLSKDSDRPVDEHTVFEIGSITKVFTAILLADMAERGLVCLDDPVQNHLPAGSSVPSRDGRQITLRDLATHRSALPRMPDNFAPADAENPYADYDGQRLLAFLAGHELARDIGSRYEYSNLGAGLLGFALAHRAGKSYEKLLIERIAQPLEMKDTRITLTDDLRARMATGHAGGQPVKNWDLDALAGAGALRSTAADMIRFLRANMGLADTSASAALKAAQAVRTPTTDSDLSVALGWHVWEKFDTTIIWHNGGTGGYHSFCGFDPQARRGVVVLTNSTDDIDDIGLHLLEPKFELKPLRETKAVSATALDDYVGHYELAPGVLFHITREGDQLFAQLTGQGKFPVFPESKDRFFYRVVNAQLAFIRGDDGKVQHLVLHQNGEHKAQRLEGYEPPVHVEVPVSAEVLARHVGRYELAPGVVIDVTLDGEQLSIQLTGQPRFPMFPESRTRFFLKVVEATLEFEQDESGESVAAVLRQGGIEQRAKRID